MTTNDGVRAELVITKDEVIVRMSHETAVVLNLLVCLGTCHLSGRKELCERTLAVIQHKPFMADHVTELAEMLSVHAVSRKATAHAG